MSNTPTQPDLAALADQYCQAWLSHDVDAIIALHTPDSRFHSHGRGHVARGREALQSEFNEVLARYPELGIDVHRLRVGDRHWVLDWSLTFQADTGERRGFRCLDLVEITDDGLISDKDTYFDLAEVKNAMGAAS